MANDDELAQLILSRKSDEETSATPPLEEFSPEVARLTDVYDRLGELITAVNILITRRPQRPPRAAPRPETAFDRARTNRVMDSYSELVSEVEEAQRRYVQERGG